MDSKTISLNLLRSIKPVRYSHGFTLSAGDEKKLARALKLWPFGVQEFDRIAVEKLGIPPTALCRVRVRNPKTLGCYDRRVIDRYPHFV